MNWLASLGRYYALMVRTFSKPEKFSIYWKQILREIESLGLGSLGIVAIISMFMGAVITIQSAFGFESPCIP